MYLPDTDHMSLLERGEGPGLRIRERLRSIPAEFRKLQASRVRIGTMDLRIAAIAIANDATLLTRNLSDFGKVPGLRAEDWSA